MTILLIGLDPDSVSDAYLAQVRALAPDMQLLVTTDPAEMEAALDHIEIAAASVPRGILARAPNLRWYQNWGAGVDWLLHQPDVPEYQFILTNVSGVHAIPISEHIFALMLAFARRLHDAVRAQTNGCWIHHTDLGAISELAGKTMVLVGTGAIGGRTARLARGLEMRVLGVRRYPAVESPCVEAMYGPDQLLDILPAADYLVLAMPLTFETRHMIGEAELRAMKPTAALINIGRGGTVDQEALIEALREGWIAAAGLDVFETEPLPEDSPLWGMDNAVLTYHYAGSTPAYNDRAMTIFIDNLCRYRSGEPMRNVVDKKLGY
jgi:phosphoglycerate dehydrogenase-like enzyme